MYADYDFYTGTFYGTAINEADFPRLASRASDFLDYYTLDKAAGVTDADTVTKLAKACCAIAEQMQLDDNARALILKAQTEEQAGKGIKSESVGAWSATYTTASDYTGADAKSAQAASSGLYAALAMRYLATTGLLYRGGC